MEKGYKIEKGNFGKRLPSLRKAKSLSQIDLALSSGIDRTGISRIENGQKNIKSLIIVKLTMALEIDIMDLLKNIK